MPNYNFRNNETQEEFTEFMSMSDLDEYLEANPHIEQIPSAINLHSGTGLGVRKTDEGFKDLLRSKKSFYKNSTINV